MRAAPYDSERVLQELLAKYPSVLAGHEIDVDVPRRWLFVAREVAVPLEQGGFGVWSLDHLFLDQDGIPTLVEVKRRGDTRIRREVVGQMLDYAANAVVYWPLEDLKLAFAQTCERNGKVTEATLSEFLGPDADLERFWRTVSENLRQGNIRLVFVADELPPELRRIIEFLNEQMSPAEVLGVEVRQYIGEGLQTLVPRVVGHTRQADVRKGPTGESWDRERFVSAVRAKLPDPSVRAVERLPEVCERTADAIGYGKGLTGSFSPKFSKASSRSFFTVRANGDLQINRKWHDDPDAGQNAARARDEFVSRLRNAGLSVPDTPFPTVAAQVWTPISERVTAVIVEQFAGLENRSNVGTSE
jgi:hypothetical protein